MTFSADDLDEPNARQIEKRRGFLMVSAVFRPLTEAEREELVGLVMPGAEQSEYDGHCPTCDAPEPTHAPTCAVVKVQVPEPSDSEASDV